MLSAITPKYGQVQVSICCFHSSIAVESREKSEELGRSWSDFGQLWNSVHSASHKCIRVAVSEGRVLKALTACEVFEGGCQSKREWNNGIIE